MDKNKLFWLGLPLLLLVLWLGKKWYQAPKFANGYEAPNFTGTKPDGSTLQLQDFRGKLVLIDFWGSWCPPCRAENPDLVKLYNTYHNASFANAQGFEIISIAVETEKEAWLAAIQKDGLLWDTHVSTLERFNDPIVEAYGVKEIPSKYLLNEKGLIIAVNPDTRQLEKLLKERLKS